MQLSWSYDGEVHDEFFMHLLSSGSLMLESCFTSESHEIVIRLPHTARTMQEDSNTTPLSNHLHPARAHKQGHLVTTTQISEKIMTFKMNVSVAKLNAKGPKLLPLASWANCIICIPASMKNTHGPRWASRRSSWPAECSPSIQGEKNGAD